MSRTNNPNTKDGSKEMEHIIPTKISRLQSMTINESVTNEKFRSKSKFNITLKNNLPNLNKNKKKANLFCSYRIFIALLLGSCTLISYAQSKSLIRIL